MEATSVPRLAKPTAKCLGSGHHPTPPGTLCSSSNLIPNVVPTAFSFSLQMTSLPWCYSQFCHLDCCHDIKDLCHFPSGILGISGKSYLSSLEESSFPNTISQLQRWHSLSSNKVVSLFPASKQARYLFGNTCQERKTIYFRIIQEDKSFSFGVFLKHRE